MDFFDTQYITETARNEVRFGLVDDGLRARSAIGDEHRWLAVVNNPQCKEVQFVPVDHNIKMMDGKNERSMCDGMLYDKERSWLAFVEMKEQISEWMRDARNQLESTIEAFRANHDENLFRYRFAYAANRKHPHFQFSQKETMQRFRNKFNFRLLFQKNIDVK